MLFRSAEQQAALAEGLAAARQIGYEWFRAQALSALAAQLTGAERQAALAEGLAAARQIENEYARAQALSALAAQLTGDLLAEGLAAARQIRDERYRAEALSALAAQLTGDLLAEGLAAARQIEDKEHRAEALGALAPQLAEWPRPVLTSSWQETLRLLASRTRSDLLADLGVLTPVIVALGGEAAVAETCRAIRDVGRWWS